MGIGKVSSLAAASLSKVSSLAKLSIGKISSATASFASAFSNTYSLAFGGTDEYVAMSSLAYDTGSWVLWVKYEGTATGNMILMNARNDYYLYATANASGGNLGFLYPGRASLTNWPAPGGDAGVGDDSWHQLAMTIARPGDIGTTATVKIYLDGELVDTETGTRVFTLSSNVLYFGRYSSSALYYTGNMDEIGWWSEHVLTDSEVTALYNSGEPIDLQTDAGDYSSSGNLTSYWRMGDGDTFATITDKEGSNNGTMTNMESGDIVTVVPG